MEYPELKEQSIKLLNEIFTELNRLTEREQADAIKVLIKELVIVHDRIIEAHENK